VIARQDRGGDDPFDNLVTEARHLDAVALHARIPNEIDELRASEAHEQ
jgi:hypothetical protein